jgi:hypothetical protein
VSAALTSPLIARQHTPAPTTPSNANQPASPLASQPTSQLQPTQTADCSQPACSSLLPTRQRATLLSYQPCVGGGTCLLQQLPTHTVTHTDCTSHTHDTRPPLTLLTGLVRCSTAQSQRVLLHPALVTLVFMCPNSTAKKMNPVLRNLLHRSSLHSTAQQQQQMSTHG